MVILIKKRHRSLPVAVARVRGVLRRVFAMLETSVPGLSGKEVSVLFTNDEEIRTLNLRYRGKDRPTNVLSFPLLVGEGAGIVNAIGDVVISVDTARREAEAAGIAMDDTIDALLIHGVLHLTGYDHERVATTKARQMREKEEEIFFAIKGRLPER